jgi:predicted porin
LYLVTSFADATIYGVFDQAYQSDKVTVGAGTANTKKGISGSLNGGNALGFKGNEDLGNGINANFLIEFGMESSDSMSGYSAGTAAGLLGTPTTATPSVSNGVSNRQSFVGLSGGFGSVKIGKQYSEVFNAACAYDLGGCAAMVGSLPLIIISDADTDVRRSNQVNFSLPKFVDGLSINVGKSFGEAVKLGSSATNNAGDGTNYSISYRTGGFAGTLASETLDNTGVHPFLGTDNKVSASPTSKKKTSVTGLSYDIGGMAKVAYTNTKATVGTGSVKANSFGVSVPFGAASVAFETSTGDLKGTSAAATTSKLKASQLAFNYSLSKRTLAYFRQGSHTENKSTGANALKVSTTAFGVNHSF